MNFKLRSMIKISIVFYFLLTFLYTSMSHAAESAKPNVIMILADDLGYGDLGCYGHPTFKTPHIDQLAKEGIKLTQFNTPAPFCAPTRASLLTGRYPWRCGMTQNPTPDGGEIADKVALPSYELLLPQLLKSNGYSAAMIGKWHLGHHAGFFPTDRGFDEYLGIPYSNDMRPVSLFAGTKVIEYPLVQATLTQRYTDHALSYITAHQTKPFFLYLAHAMPHKPLASSEEYYQKSGTGLYGDVLAELDACVGKVVAKIDELGLAKNTLIIFSSDNGAWYGGSCGGLRGMKGTSWEGGYRVPMIARWTGKIPAAQSSDNLTVMMDLFATIMAATHTNMSDNRVIDGKNLLPLFTGDKTPVHDVILGMQGGDIATIRNAQFKLHVKKASHRVPLNTPENPWKDKRAPDGVTILAPYEQFSPTAYPGLTAGIESQSMQLFDLKNDPGEQVDVTKDHPEIVKQLKTRYDEFQQESLKLNSKTKN